MSAARNSLQAVLDRQAQSAPPPSSPSPSPPRTAAPRRKLVEPDQPPKTDKFYRPSREGQRLIAGHFDPKVAKQLKLLAAEEDTTVQALLEEALNLLFVKKGQGTIQNV
jgi:hypothetical protein